MWFFRAKKQGKKFSYLVKWDTIGNSVFHCDLARFWTHSWLRTLSNHVFKSQIKFYPIFLLAENRELNEMMVVALRKPFQSYQYSTGIYLTWYCQKMPKTPYLWLFMYYLVLLSHFKQQKFEKFLPAIQAEKKVYEKNFLEFFVWP